MKRYFLIETDELDLKDVEQMIYDKHKEKYKTWISEPDQYKLTELKKADHPDKLKDLIKALFYWCCALSAQYELCKKKFIYDEKFPVLQGIGNHKRSRELADCWVQIIQKPSKESKINLKLLDDLISSEKEAENV